MKTSFVLVAACAAALGAPALADPLGIWTVTSQSGAGPSVSTMTVTEADGGHALTYESDAGESTISALMIDGDHVMFTRLLSGTQIGDIVLNYDITIDGDTLTGVAKVNGEAASFIGDEIALEGARE